MSGASSAVVREPTTSNRGFFTFLSFVFLRHSPPTVLHGKGLRAAPHAPHAPHLSAHTHARTHAHTHTHTHSHRSSFVIQRSSPGFRGAASTRGPPVQFALQCFARGACGQSLWTSVLLLRASSSPCVRLLGTVSETPSSSSAAETTTGDDDCDTIFGDGFGGVVVGKGFVVVDAAFNKAALDSQNIHVMAPIWQHRHVHACVWIPHDLLRRGGRV